MSDEVMIDKRALEIQENFSLDGYQVSRREMFSHVRESSITIRRDSITFNSACVNNLDDAVYVQLLINPEEKRLVVRKCQENDKDAIRWCIVKEDKKKSRRITSRIFSAKVYEMMKWNSEYRYKLLAHKISFEGEEIFVFELKETEIYKEKKKADTAVAKTDVIPAEAGTESEQQIVTRYGRQKAMYPESWRDNFGMPVEEHKQALIIDTVNGYALAGQ